MTRRQLQIRLGGDLADSTAEALGCRLRRDRSIWLVAEYVDQAHLTGLIAQLAALNIPFEAVHVGDETGTVAASDASTQKLK